MVQLVLIKLTQPEFGLFYLCVQRLTVGVWRSVVGNVELLWTMECRQPNYKLPIPYVQLHDLEDQAKTESSYPLASFPGLPRFLIVASDLKAASESLGMQGWLPTAHVNKMFWEAVSVKMMRLSEKRLAVVGLFCCVCKDSQQEFRVCGQRYCYCLYRADMNSECRQTNQSWLFFLSKHNHMINWGTKTGSTSCVLLALLLASRPSTTASAGECISWYCIIIITCDSHHKKVYRYYSI